MAGFNDEEGLTGSSLPYPVSWGGAAARVLAKKQEMLVGSAVCGGGGYTFRGLGSGDGPPWYGVLLGFQLRPLAAMQHNAQSKSYISK